MLLLVLVVLLSPVFVCCWGLGNWSFIFGLILHPRRLACCLCKCVTMFTFALWEWERLSPLLQCHTMPFIHPFILHHRCHRHHSNEWFLLSFIGSTVIHTRTHSYVCVCVNRINIPQWVLLSCNFLALITASFEFIKMPKCHRVG